jgi:predicted nuclease of predicted toxin-antitoxin system
MTEPESITFFIDRCLGSKRIVEKLKSAGISVEIHDDHFGKSAKDIDWLPEVGKRGWVVLTKDSSIAKNFLERIAVARAGIKMFAFASQSVSGEEMATIFLNTIVSMQEFVHKHPAPFIAKIYRDGRLDMWKNHEALMEELEQ